MQNTFIGLELSTLQKKLKSKIKVTKTQQIFVEYKHGIE